MLPPPNLHAACAPGCQAALTVLALVRAETVCGVHNADVAWCPGAADLGLPGGEGVLARDVSALGLPLGEAATLCACPLGGPGAQLRWACSGRWAPPCPQAEHARCRRQPEEQRQVTGCLVCPGQRTAAQQLSEPSARPWLQQHSTGRQPGYLGTLPKPLPYSLPLPLHTAPAAARATRHRAAPAHHAACPTRQSWQRPRTSAHAHPPLSSRKAATAAPADHARGRTPRARPSRAGRPCPRGPMRREQPLDASTLVT